VTEQLGPDEKRCPFCAEVIRAAAVKCRYCHSDLPIDPDAEPEHSFELPGAGGAHDIRDTPLTPEDPPAPVAWPVEAPEPPAAGPAASVLTPAITIMLAVCLVLAAGIATIVWSARPDDLRTAGNGQVTVDSYRSAAMSAAAADAKTVLSYSYKTLDADQKAARGVLSPSYAKEYSTAMQKAGPKALKDKLTLQTTVESTSLISLTKSSAKLLLFVNTVTTAAGSDHQQLLQNRVMMTLTRKDGDWVVSKMAPF